MTLKRKLEDCQDFRGVPSAESFYTYIDGALQRITDRLTELFEDIRHTDSNKDNASFQTIREDATQGYEEGNTDLKFKATESSFVAIIMQHAYDEAQKVSSTAYQVQGAAKKINIPKAQGPNAQRLDILRKHVQGTSNANGLFPELAKECKKALRDLLNGRIDRDGNVIQGWKAKIERVALEGIIRISQSSSKHTLSETVAEMEMKHNPEMTNELIEAAQQALTALAGPVLRDFTECESYEKGDAA
ncbi:hypothetical protein BAUCODRAFT_122403 [Baudoinia panamericana UAMH 10762]|uniref:Uncharacterized protein n=1 Tax=Baudoinia panamericana (strain UAMH 10762) TaxID=717646 RepID=M2LPR5_BAUPA|nr:uncharacterized protein BAUCODRAFT_122403 [Baudoinia panamericana UAMH 10762]EMC96397.1 hypothetical protein BAUCODRAFT_122403 [Baudoinia panamericana UAMH 10762]